MDNVKFKITVPNQYRCKCSNDTYIVIELAEDSGYVESHNSPHKCFGYMQCSECHKEASDELKHYLFGTI